MVGKKNTLILHSETIDSDMKAISIRFKGIIGHAMVLTAAALLAASCTGARSGDKRARASDKQVPTAAGQRTANNGSAGFCLRIANKGRKYIQPIYVNVSR